MWHIQYALKASLLMASYLTVVIVTGPFAFVYSIGSHKFMIVLQGAYTEV